MSFCRFIKMKSYYMLLLLSILLLPGLLFADGLLKLPPIFSPEEYGDVLINRVSKEHNVTPVVFSHWIHRVKYTCRVCHYEIEFSMKSGDTPIVCDNGKMKGMYCATCHNGKDAFGPKGEDGENCSKCHNADSSPERKKFHELLDKLPKDNFGNEVNWTKALEEGLIKPKDSLSGDPRELVNIATLVLKAEMAGIPSAVFPHKIHEQWLDCSSCHPDLFNIKKKTTGSLRMANMLKGESCAVCHLRIAFPLDDCKKCHPDMRR
jgi:c(7)-type cytochrome triheme protein